MVNYLCLAQEVNMAELKTNCMDWLRDRWDTINEKKEIKDLLGIKEGQVICELLNYAMNRKRKYNDDT